MAGRRVSFERPQCTCGAAGARLAGHDAAVPSLTSSGTFSRVLQRLTSMRMRRVDLYLMSATVAPYNHRGTPNLTRSGWALSLRRALATQQLLRRLHRRAALTFCLETDLAFLPPSSLRLTSPLV